MKSKHKALEKAKKVERFHDIKSFEHRRKLMGRKSTSQQLREQE